MLGSNLEYLDYSGRLEVSGGAEIYFNGKARAPNTIVKETLEHLKHRPEAALWKAAIEPIDLSNIMPHQYSLCINLVVHRHDENEHDGVRIPEGRIFTLYGTSNNFRDLLRDYAPRSRTRVRRFIKRSLGDFVDDKELDWLVGLYFQHIVGPHDAEE